MKGRAKLLNPNRDNLFRLRVDEATGARVMEKSCPKCSKKAGTTVYYPEGDFPSTGSGPSNRECLKHRKVVQA
jgi:hypothetical protein